MISQADFALKILVIAPNSNLPNIEAEIAAISRHHDATVLPGTVRDLDIAQAVTEQTYDVLWVVGHGNEHGIQLASEHLDIDALIQYIRSGEISLCILNTCSSESVALRIASVSDADVICSISEIPNPAAIRLGILLADELSKTDSFRDAYNQAAPNINGTYRYYSAKDEAITRSSRHDPQLYRIEGEVKSIKTWLVIISVIMVIFVLAYAILWIRVDANFERIINLMLDKGR